MKGRGTNSRRVVLITGGMSGIGLAAARRFAGANGVVSVVDRKRTQEGEGMVQQSGGRFFEADVADFARAEEVVREVTAKHSRLDVLINNAGIARDHVLWKMTEAEWDDVISVHLKGSFNYLRAASEGFRRQNAGRVVNVSSINALRGRWGLANYAAAKAGIIGLTRSAARELGKYNVTVNAVAPGLIDTPLIAALGEEERERARRESALGRIGTPEDVAALIFFLCSEDAGFITGQVIAVDGGQTA